MQAPDWLPQYGGMSALALFGSLARGRSWRSQDGKLMWARVIPEAATAVCLSVAVMALGDWVHVDLKIVAAIAVFAGWLGPAAVGDMVLARIGVKS